MNDNVKRLAVANGPNIFQTLLVVFYIGSRRFGSDPLDVGCTDVIRPYSLPTPLGVPQELGGYARAASWGPPSTTMPFTAPLSTFLPPPADTSATADVSRRPSLTSSFIRPTSDASALAVRDFLSQQQSVTCLPSEPRAGSFPLQKQPPSTSSGDPNIDEIRQSLLSMSSLNSVFETNSGNPFTQTTVFDQSIPAASDSCHKQQSFPPASTSFLQPGSFSTQSNFDPNFNALASAPLGQLAMTTTCGENIWQASCLPFGDTNLCLYPGNRMLTDTSQAAAAANNNEAMGDARQDSSLWRPY